jgi:hypothetical protein
MSPKIVALLGQASLAAIAWWMTKSEQERRAIQAGLWKEIEELAMRWAISASDLAAYAERKYKQTVMV